MTDLSKISNNGHQQPAGFEERMLLASLLDPENIDPSAAIGLLLIKDMLAGKCDFPYRREGLPATVETL